MSILTVICGAHEIIAPTAPIGGQSPLVSHFVYGPQSSSLGALSVSWMGRRELEHER